MKTRTYLLLMLVALIVPVACVATFGLSMMLRFERESRIRAIEELANSTSLLIDGEIARAEASLRVIANSRELRDDDFPALYRLLAATSTTPLSWTLIADDTGSGLLNTLVPYGTPLARNTGRWAADIYEAQRFRVGGYFIGATSKRGVVQVNMPVPRAAGKKYVVTQIFDPRYFDRVFQRAALRPGWIVGVFDANGISIARNRAAGQFVGKRVRPELWDASRREASGVARHPTREGIDVYDIFVRSPLTGWTVAIGVPVDEIESAARMTTRYAAIALLLILGTAVSIAVFCARRIDRALKDATGAAQALAQGRAVPLARSGLQEADQLLDVLQAAGAALERESAARGALETERQQLLTTEREARLHAEAQDRAKDNFISMLSHELRNPLAAITTAVSMLQLPQVPAPHKARAWDVVNRQLAHFTRLVGDLMDLRRVLSGRVALQKSRVDLAELLRFCCDSKRVTDSKEHDWHVAAADAWTVGDRTRLMQVIDNVLANAIKYTPAGGRIAVTLALADGMAVIDIADTGVGIAVDVLPTIFDSLVQGPTTIDRSQGGLGLGLSIARGLTQMHGGTIVADSDGLGMGSRFTIRLPTAAPAL